MKLHIITLYILVLCFFFVYSSEIKYKDDAINSLQKIEAKKKNIFNLRNKHFTVFNKKEVYSFSFEEKKEYLSKKYKELNINDREKRIQYSNKGGDVKGRASVDEKTFRKLAFDYLKENIPLQISKREKLKITDVKYERSIHEERDNNGNIKNDTHLRTHSVIISIGRCLYGQPIFNSNVVIGFNSVTKEVIYLDAQNWISINEIEEENIKNISKESITNAIENRIDNYIVEHVSKENLNIQNNVDVIEIILGWYIDEYNDLLPAVIHHEKMMVLSDTQLEPIERNPAFIDILY